MIIKEMALSRSDAISICMGLGVQFIEHYQKIVNEGIDSKSTHHHCKEMQAWYNKVKSVRLKPNNRRIRADQLQDWFFTAGGDIEDYLDDNAVSTYPEFCIKLLISGDVEESIKYVLGKSS